jgi:K+-transporting ATPase ATPase C chain
LWSARLAWLEDKQLTLRKPEMIKHLRPAIMLIVLMTALTGLAYPLAMTGTAGFLFPYQANGSLIERDGKIIGSELIGQNFTSDGYFHGRPSATTDTDPNDSTKTVPAPYNASNSGGSNYGPTSKALVDRVKADSGPLAATNPSAKIPGDLVTTSASGLDPDITPAAALFQIPRVAAARKLPEDELRRLVEDNTTARLLGILGEPHVNVLKLNLALDKLAKKS